MQEKFEFGKRQQLFLNESQYIAISKTMKYCSYRVTTANQDNFLKHQIEKSHQYILVYVSSLEFALYPCFQCFLHQTHFQKTHYNITSGKIT